MRRGHFGKVLKVDLTAKVIREVGIPSAYYRKYLGGYGLGVRLLFDWMTPGAEPLGPGNVLGLVPGLLTGTGAPFSGRYMAVARSPLTGTWGDSNSGGFFGPELRRTGYDGVFFIGASDTPVYLSITDHGAAIHDAGDLWGMDTHDTERILEARHPKARVACIGPSGEGLSLISGIVTHRGRIAARSGLGAVMGSKKLKAVVVKGNSTVPLADIDAFRRLRVGYNRRFEKRPGKLMRMGMSMGPSAAGFSRRFGITSAPGVSMMRSAFQIYGTTIGNTLSAEIGDSPVKNWKGVGHIDFPLKESQKISGDEMLAHVTDGYGCANCPLRCGALMDLPEKGLRGVHRPEYETASAFGTLLLNSDMASLVEAADICNRAGMDTISAGATIAFAMECVEEGIISDKELGFELKWGDAGSVLRLLRAMTERKGFGGILADGVERASRKIGRGADRFAVHAGGQELPMHDPRFCGSLAFTYALDPTPGRHTAASIDLSEMGPVREFLKGAPFAPGRRDNMSVKAKNQRVITAIHQVVSAAGLCLFSMNMGEYPLLEILNASTGWGMGLDELLDTGLRIQALRQIFTLREKEDAWKGDIHPRAVGEPPLPKGPTAGVRVDLSAMRRAFYRELGYDAATGLPLEEEAERLGIARERNEVSVEKKD